MEGVKHETIDLSILGENSTSIWIPNQLDAVQVDTHLTSTSSLNSNELPTSPQEFLPPKKLELNLDKFTSHSVVAFNCFTKFIMLAEKKIDAIMDVNLRAEMRLDNILAKGVDYGFDSMLEALGSVGSQNPVLLIESLLTWRKIKSSTLSVKEIRRQSRSQALLVERINMGVSYITIRCILETLHQVKQPRSLDKCGSQLEEFAFSLLKSFTPHTIAKSSNHQSLYKLIGELIKCLSNLRFSTMSDRFIAILEQVPEDPSATLENEDLIIITIHSMKYLKLKIYPDDALEETSEFLLSCATFFRRTLHLKLKSAYAEAFVEMLLPIVQVVDAEVNFPILVKAVELLEYKASKLLYKTRHFNISLPLMTTVIGLSQKEIFQTKWIGFFEICCQKIRDRSAITNSLCCISRLLWVYLFRCSEPTQLLHKRLDTIFRQIFSVNPRRNLVIYEGPMQHYYYLIYYVLSHDPDYAFDNWITPLLQLELNSGANLLDGIIPERFTLCLRAFLLYALDDFKSIKMPSFPQAIDFNFNNPTQSIVYDPFPFVPFDFDIKFGFNTKVQDILSILVERLELILPALENSFGSFLLNNDKYLNNRPKVTASSPGSNEMFSNAREGLSSMAKQPYSNLLTFHVIYSRDKQPYFDLITSWLDSIPLLIPSSIPNSRLIEWVSKLTFHVDPQVSKSACEAIKRLCLQKELYLQVIRSLSKTLKNLDVQFSELISPIYYDVDNERKLNQGPRLLDLYLEILELWLAFLKDKKHLNQPLKLDIDTSLVWNLIEEIEALAIMFLSSPLVATRLGAFKTFNLVAKIDQTFDSLTRVSNSTLLTTKSEPLYNDTSRLYTYDLLMSSRADAVITEALTSRKFTHKFIEKAKSLNINSVYSAATSEEKEAHAIWNFVFPKISKMILEISPITTVLSRHLISSKLKMMYPFIAKYSERPVVMESPISFEMYEVEHLKILNTDDILLAHWGQYLSFVCATITLSFDSKPEPSYKKKDTKNNEGISSAKDLFRLILVLLSCENKKIRSTVVSSLCHINHNIYRLFIEDLHPFIRLVQEDTKARVINKDFKTKRKQDMFREGITQCLAMTADIMQDQEYLEDHTLAHRILEFVKEVLTFLSQPDVQANWEHQELRIYFCELARKLYIKLSMVKQQRFSMPFDIRFKIFNLAEKWCGHGQHRNSTREREVFMMKTVLENYTDVIQRGAKTLAMEDLRKSLESSALNLMAALCKGPIITNQEDDSDNISYRNSGGKPMFDLPSIFRWIESIFKSVDKRVHHVGKEALDGLMKCNLDNPLLFEKILHSCYAGDPSDGFTKACFLTLGQVLVSYNNHPVTTGKKISLICFKIGDTSASIRVMGCKILRHYYKAKSTKLNNQLDYLCELAAHPITTIYEKARYNITEILALSHPDLVLEIFSEIIMRLTSIMEPSLRSILNSLIPWIKRLQLTTESDNPNELTPVSNAIITNLLFLVVKYSEQYPSEIEALWLALFYSNSNVAVLKAVIYSLIYVNLEKRNPSLVFFTKNIFIYLSHTKAGLNVFDYLMELLTPDSMIPKKKLDLISGWDKYKELSVPLYIVNLDEIILTHTKRSAFSVGQLILIFISDMLLSIDTKSLFLPLLLHLGACQAYDSGLLLKANEELAQPILPNLLLGLLHSSQRDTVFSDEIERIFSAFLHSKLETNVKSISHSAQSSLSLEIDVPEESEIKTPLCLLVNATMSVFSTYTPELMEMWCETASKWATSCPVRSVAKSSFKIYRLFQMPLQPTAAIDILSRLSLTISDTSTDIQNFAYEILSSLETRIKTIQIDQFELTPPLFWFLIGVLNSFIENEHFLSLQLLDTITKKSNNINVFELSRFLSYLPDNLYLPSIEDSLIAGLISPKTSNLAFKLLYRFTELPFKDLIVDLNKVYLILMLTVMPYLLDFTNINDIHSNIERQSTLPISIQGLIQIAELAGCQTLADIINTISSKTFRSEEICLRTLIQNLRNVYLPNYEDIIFNHLLTTLRSSDDITLTKRRLKLLRCFLPLMENGPNFDGKEDYISLLPLLGLINVNEIKNEALEAIEDILSSCPSSLFNNNKYGLWGVMNEDQDEIYSNAIGGNSTNNSWYYPHIPTQQTLARQLLSTISTAAQRYINLERNVSNNQEDEKTGDSPNVNTFGNAQSRRLSPISGNSSQAKPLIQLTSPSTAGLHPPKMMDFYTMSSFTSPFAKAKTPPLVNSTLPNLNISIPDPRSFVHFEAKHQKNKSSCTSILDYYGFKKEPKQELKELSKRFEALEKRFL